MSATVSSIRFAVPLGDRLSIQEARITSLSLIGKGSYASVYKRNVPLSEANGENTFRALAIKVGFHTSSIYRQQMKEEIRILEKIKGCVNVISIIGWNKEPDHISITMSYVDGKSMHEYFCKSGKIYPSIDLIHVCLEVGKALAFLKNSDVVHGDLTINNIMIGANLKVTIIDFGLAQDLTKRSVQQYEMYPLNYRPPECILKVPFCDNASDVWSFGIALFGGYTTYALIRQPEGESHTERNNLLFAFERILGKPPLDLLARARNASYYHPQTNQLVVQKFTKEVIWHPPSGLNLIDSIGKMRESEDLNDLAFFKQLVQRMIVWDPRNRIAPEKIVNEICAFLDTKIMVPNSLTINTKDNNLAIDKHKC